MLVRASLVQDIKNRLQASMLIDQRRIEALPKLALQIQKVRKELEADPSNCSPTQFAVLDVALSTFNYGLYFHLKNSRLLNRYLEEFVQNELSKLEKLVNGQPNTERLRNRVVKTLQRLTHLQALELRRARWGSKHRKIIKIPTLKIRWYMDSTTTRKSQMAAQSKTDQRQKLFDKWKRVKLQTLQEKYGNMAFGADMMVGVLEDMEKARKKDKDKSLEEITALRKRFIQWRRKRKWKRKPEPVATAMSQTSSTYLHGGLWANFTELFRPKP